MSGSAVAADAAAWRPGLLVMHPIVVRLLAPLRDEFDVYDASNADDVLDFLRSVPAANIVAIASLGRDRCDRAVIDLLPNLRIICAVGAGIETIDLVAAAARGITVTNAGNGNADDVADHAIALWLAFRNQIERGRAWIMEDRWRRDGLMPARRSLSAERIGIVGLGNIGQRVARLASAFGAEVTWWGPNPKPEAPWARHSSVTDLARWATTLIVAARGGEDSRKLIDDAVLGALGPDGLLVNVARGFVVDEDAMIKRLRSGELAGAALDVFEQEPARPDRWRDVPNVLITPHSAGLTHEAHERLISNFVHNLRSSISGERPMNAVIGPFAPGQPAAQAG